MLDVVAWRDFIDEAYCVDKSRTNINRMTMAAQLNNISVNLQFFQGPIEYVLSMGMDLHQKPVPDQFFDIVNLDYEGEFLFQSGGSEANRRVRSLGDLFERQRSFEADFVLFITLGFRGRPGNEYDMKLRDIEIELRNYGKDYSAVVAWYLSQHQRHKSKVFVPYVVDEQARSRRFRMNSYKAFYYQGTGGVPMMHFAFDMRYSENQEVPARIDLCSLLHAPLFIVSDSHIDPDPHSPPYLDDA
ncbi:MAG: hypothetical protein JRN35_06865 [Nitrososphaerota archaeon]|nr:hypothetical protein [Nitrososphaerota archaeon]